MRRALAWPVFLGAGIFLSTYVPRLGAPLLWDDYGTIVLNPKLGIPVPLRTFVTRDYFDFSREQSWRPLATASYHVLLRAGGLKSRVLRGSSLLLHLVNAALLALLLAALGVGTAASAWAAALFLVHPAHIETLMCVAFNEEILAALGILLMLWAHRSGLPGLAALGLAAAALSKETGLLGFGLLILHDALLRPRSSRTDGAARRAYLYCGAAAALYALLRFFLLARPPGAEGAALALPPGERAYFGLSGLATAARVFFVPLRLRIEYFALPPDTLLEGAAHAAMAAGVLVGIGYWVKRLRKKDGLSAFFLLWPILFLLPTSGLFPFQLLNLRLFAERWLYLPSLGLSALLGIAAAKRPRLATILLLFWGACGLVRMRDWKSEARLWSSLREIYPWSAKVEEGLGEALFREGRYREALVSFEAALSLREKREDRILSHYVEKDPGRRLAWESPSLYRWLGHAGIKLDDMEAAQRYFSKAARLDPRDGFTYRIMAYQHASRKDFKKAEAWVERGLNALPDEPFLLRLRRDIALRKLSFGANF